ncbi:amidoligase family protein, partial [Enterocloster asparagiformis]|uniref:amidoligase family protein n=1 Tax=Enterocloster asparagiformis TaxID=333367 RepID=UPI002A827C0F
TASDPGESCYKTRTIKDSSGRYWKVMRDGSIAPAAPPPHRANDAYKVEFVTPPLQYGDIDLLLKIVQDLKNAGAITNSSCGIHIHVDGANHSPASLRRLVHFMVFRQDLVYEAFEIGRRANQWCKKLSPELFDEMKKNKSITPEDIETIWYSERNDNYTRGINHSHYNITRYHGINLHSYFSKKTVEFRLFNSTLHTGLITAYLQFCLALSAWAIEGNDHTVFRSMAGYNAQQKVTIMRNILTHRLGLYGDEFKTCRSHIMAPLKKKAAEERTAA